VETKLPEGQERPTQTEGDFRILLIESPFERAMEIALFCFKTIQPDVPFLGVLLRLGLLGKRQELRGVPLADGAGFATRVEQLNAVLAHRFQQGVSGIAGRVVCPPDQAMRDQRP
jgi:hypothetical protein